MGTISYQTNAILDIAEQMQNNANNAYAEYEAAYFQVVACITDFPFFMQDALMRLLEHEDRRFRASFQWQLDMATVLTNAASQMGDTDITLSKAFENWPKTYSTNV